MKFLNNILKSSKVKIKKGADRQFKKNNEFEFGKFDVNDFPDEYKNEPFYFYEYEFPDGELIEIDEPICKIRIGEQNGFVFRPAIIFASKSGILECTLKKDELLADGAVLYKLHSNGEYKNENSIENFEYKDFFKYSEDNYSFDKWLINDGDFVNIKESVYQFKDSKYKEHINYSKKSGFIHLIDTRKYSSVDKNELMYIIRETDEQRIKKRFINTPNIIIDEFSNSTIIKWQRVSSRAEISEGISTKSDDFITNLIFCFNYLDGGDFIVFHFNPKQIHPKQLDKVGFLFENGKQIEFELTTNPINSINRRNEKILEFKGLITESELELFANNNLKKWKISLEGNKREILGGETGDDDFYPNKNNIQIVIKKYAHEYIKLVKSKIQDYKPTKFSKIDLSNKATTDFCYVYLMHDTSNGYYKIGISNNPEYRERTLQSEKPTIENIASKKFPIRKIAESIEKALHDTYSAKRLRGEWFELDENDVEHIMETLK